jgi:hypothetical protein
MIGETSKSRLKQDVYRSGLPETENRVAARWLLRRLRDGAAAGHRRFARRDCTATGGRQTGRLFLPFDARVGRKLTDSVTLSVEIGAPIIKDYPVYNFKTQVRLNLTF